MSLTQAPGARDLAHCGRFITIAMPLDPAFGFAMVVFFFEDWLHHEYYSYAGNVHGGGRREGASVYRCIRAQGRQQKHSEGRKNTEDTVFKKKVPQGSFAYSRIRANPTTANFTIGRLAK